MCKNIMRFFQKFEDTFKHPHPYKIIQYNTPKRVTIVCFHSSFHHCCLGPKNLDLLVLLIKNWPNNPIVGFKAKERPWKNVDEFGEAEENILDLLDAKFSNEVKDYVKECV
jgi:hypothetical protein